MEPCLREKKQQDNWKEEKINATHMCLPFTFKWNNVGIFDANFFLRSFSWLLWITFANQMYQQDIHFFAIGWKCFPNELLAKCQNRQNERVLKKSISGSDCDGSLFSWHIFLRISTSHFPIFSFHIHILYLSLFPIMQTFISH